MMKSTRQAATAKATAMWGCLPTTGGLNRVMLVFASVKDSVGGHPRSLPHPGIATHLLETSKPTLSTRLASWTRGLWVGSACCFLGGHNLIAVFEGPCTDGVDGRQQGPPQSGEFVLDP
jgi:hypothetical protein